MARSTDSVVAAVVVCVTLVLPQSTPAQVTASSEPQADAVDATLTAVHYLLAEVDSIESVAWPSAKTLLARRPGIVALSGISTRRGEDPARAIALTERITAALNSRALVVRSIPRSDARYCGIGNSEHCSLPDGVGLLLLIGYPHGTDAAQMVQITMVTDSRVRAGRPVVSLDVMLKKLNGRWTVASVARTVLLSD